MATHRVTSGNTLWIGHPKTPSLSTMATAGTPIDVPESEIERLEAAGVIERINNSGVVAAAEVAETRTKAAQKAPKAAKPRASAPKTNKPAAAETKADAVGDSVADLAAESQKPAAAK